MFTATLSFLMETSLGRKTRYRKDCPSQQSQGPCKECLSGPGEEDSDDQPLLLSDRGLGGEAEGL